MFCGSTRARCRRQRQRDRITHADYVDDGHHVADAKRSRALQDGGRITDTVSTRRGGSVNLSWICLEGAVHDHDS